MRISDTDSKIINSTLFRCRYRQSVNSEMMLQVGSKRKLPHLPLTYESALALDSVETGDGPFLHLVRL